MFLFSSSFQESLTRGQFSPILFLKKNLVFLTGVRLQVLRDKCFLFAIRTFITQTVVCGFSSSSPVSYIIQRPQTWPQMQENNSVSRLFNHWLLSTCSLQKWQYHFTTCGNISYVILYLFPIKQIEVFNILQKSYWVGMQSEHLLLLSSMSKSVFLWLFQACFNGLKFQCQNVGDIFHWKCSDFKNE